MLFLKSETLKKYYGETPYEYSIKFTHPNVCIENDSLDEYKLIEEDFKNIYNFSKDEFMIYFSDLENYKKILGNTVVINKYKDKVYIRIRNSEEYELYKKLEQDSNVIVDLSNLEAIHFANENLTIQIDTINELLEDKLDNLLEHYNIKNVFVGQIAYLCEENKELLSDLSKKFNIDIDNQLEIEKNYNITNDIYDIETYKKICKNIEKIVLMNEGESNIQTFINSFNWIAESIYYNEEAVTNTSIENQNLIGPIFNKKAVCEGYSKLLQQVCSLLGIESVIVSGGGAKEDDGHVWNQVLIDNKWYNADVTSESFAKHNCKDWNLCLVPDSYLIYNSDSLFKHSCNEVYDYDKSHRKLR